MLRVDEIGKIIAYTDGYRFAGPDPGREPSNRDKVSLLGDGVTPPVLTWLTARVLAVVDEPPNGDRPPRLTRFP